MGKLVALLFMVLLAGVVWLIATVEPGGVHAFEGMCSSCHLGDPEAGLFVGKVDVLCNRCHIEQTARSHPSGFLVHRRLPSRFPLMKGRMTCVTCHFAHRVMGDESPARLRAETNPYLLRYDQMGRAFCFQCHNPENWSSRDRHGTALPVAHEDSQNPDVLQLLDRSSRDCLACHDGTISANTDTGGAAWEHAGGIGLSHPIGIPYEDPFRKGRTRYRPVSSLPKAIRLINGRIECITCHDHYSRLKGMLVMDNTGSRLCLSCHAM